MRISLRNFLIASTLVVPLGYSLWLASGCLPLYGLSRWLSEPSQPISELSHPGIPD